MKRSLCKACIVASLLFGTTALAAPASLAAEPDRAVINVTGYAQQEVAPDTAYVLSAWKASIRTHKKPALKIISS